MTIAAALLSVRERIVRAAEASGRDGDAITLIAVSKAMPSAAIREAYAAGQRAFGESYAQELDAKARELSDLPDIAWHFIGHLQTNKAKVVARAAHVVHSVDGEALARELGRRATTLGRVIPVLIEVNVAGESQKHGVAPSEIDEAMRAIQGQPSLALCGLMTIPPEDPAAARRAFETLASLRSLHGGVAALPELSMGMSSDFELAIRAGSTMVRVGTAIFGSRAPSGGPLA